MANLDAGRLLAPLRLKSKRFYSCLGYLDMY